MKNTEDEYIKLMQIEYEKLHGAGSFGDQQKKVLIFRHTLHSESDRGCALLAASHLDFILQKLLKLKLIGSKKHLEDLFSVTGSLSTFSSRIKLSYSMGLIPETFLLDLDTIKKIRNKFGHEVNLSSFDDPPIKNLVKKLHYTREKSRPTKWQFITSVLFIYGCVEGRISVEKKFPENTDLENKLSQFRY